MWPDVGKRVGGDDIGGELLELIVKGRLISTGCTQDPVQFAYYYRVMQIPDANEYYLYKLKGLKHCIFYINILQYVEIGLLNMYCTDFIINI